MAEIVDKTLALIPGRGTRKRKRSPAISAKRRAQIATVRKNLAKLAADVAKLAKVIGSDIRNVTKPAKKRTAARTGKRRTAVKRVSVKKR